REISRASSVSQPEQDRSLGRTRMRDSHISRMTQVQKEYSLRWERSGMDSLSVEQASCWRLIFCRQQTQPVLEADQLSGFTCSLEKQSSLRLVRQFARSRLPDSGRCRCDVQ